MQLLILSPEPTRQRRVHQGTYPLLSRYLQRLFRHVQSIPQFRANCAASMPWQRLLVFATPDTRTLATIAVKKVRSFNAFDTLHNLVSAESSGSTKDIFLALLSP